MRIPDFILLTKDEALPVRCGQRQNGKFSFHFYIDPPKRGLTIAPSPFSATVEILIILEIAVWIRLIRNGSSPPWKYALQLMYSLHGVDQHRPSLPPNGPQPFAYLYQLGNKDFALRFWVKRLVSSGLLLLSSSAHASTQCPAQYGDKSPVVNLLGWLFVGLGVVAGCSLFACLFNGSLKLKLAMRVFVVAFGLVAMLAMWIGSFGLAFFYFFFKC